VWFGIKKNKYINENSSIHIRKTNFPQKHESSSMEKKWSFQQMVLEQLDIHRQTNKQVTLQSVLCIILKINSGVRDVAQ
jgi:hypothetical protein